MRDESFSSANLSDFEIPDGWIICSFGDLFNIKGGSQPPKSEFSVHPQPGYIRLLQIRDFNSDEFAVYIRDSNRWLKCSEDDLLIARYGASLGKICTGKSGAYNVALARLIFDRNNLDKGWVEAFLKSRWFQAPLFLVSRSAQNGFNKDELSPRSVPLPPLNEQRRIVTKIEALMARSQRAKEALEAIPPLLDQFRQSVLAAAFRGDLTAEWREKNSDIEPASELLRRTSNQLNQNFDEETKNISRDRQFIPNSWVWTPLKLFVKHIQAGKNFSCPEIPVTEDTVGLVKISSVTWGRFDNRETKTVIDQSKIDSSLFIQKGDFLISRANTIELVGASVVVEEINYKIMLSDKVWRVSFLEVENKFINFYLKSKYGRKEIESRATGNQLSMRNISQNAFRDIVIALPPLKEQQEIVRRVQTFFQAADQIKQQHQEAKNYLDQLDQSILTKAFRGELVPQDPNDEPASVLLERIRAERDQVDKSKKANGKGTGKGSRKAKAKATTPEQLSLPGLE